jgi:YjbR
MAPATFRKLALALPGAVESAHMSHPDFRVGGKIFATLGYPDEQWAMVKLTPEQQAEIVRSEPAMFQPVKGGWGRGGATNVHLRAAQVAPVRAALALARQNLAARRRAEEPADD